MNILFIVMWRVFIQVPPIILTSVNLEELTNCEQVVPISFKRMMSFWRLRLDLHPTSHHLNIGVQVRLSNRIKRSLT